MLHMEALLSLYRETLAEDIQDTLKQANAHTLQRQLYENSDVFGQLCKYDNFHRAFCVPPNPCESVSFLRFWRGVEDAATATTDSALMNSISLDLQKALFMDDDHIRTMRHFRDELLRQESPMPISTFLSIIDSCNANAETTDFWSHVRENSYHIFDDNMVCTDEVSNMVLGHLSHRAYKEQAKPMHLRTMSTCVSLEDNNDLIRTHSDLSSMTSPSSHRSSSDYRYRKLLEELDVCLPTMYNNFCDRIEELNTEKEHLESERQHHEKLFNKLQSEFATTKTSLQSHCETLQECNTELHRKIDSKDKELETYRIQAENLQMRTDTTDSSRTEDELQTYMKRCAGLEQANMRLRDSLGKLEKHIMLVNTNNYHHINAHIGANVDDADGIIPNKEPSATWSSPQEREQLLKELENYKTHNDALSRTIEDMKRTVESLSRKLTEAQQRESNMENLKDHIPIDQDMTEALQGRIGSMETEMKSLHELVTTLQNDYRASETERHTALTANSHLERELAAAHSAKLSMERELDALRKQGKDMTAATLELQHQLDECQTYNAELRAHLEIMELDRLDLLAQIDKLTGPMSTIMDTAQSTNTEDDGICPESSFRTDITNGDDDNCEAPGAPCDNMIKINPALAETRRLNTLNAVKYGQVNTNQAVLPLPSTLNLEPPVIMANRRTFAVQRSMTVLEDEVDIKPIQDPSEMHTESSQTVSFSGDDTDVFQDAAAYFSERFNFGVRPDG